MFEAVFAAVLILRFGVPLFIPRFPLPAIVTALVIDGVDQSMFQQVTDDPLEWYQGYDKALDIYYLSIAYLATIRNWTDTFAFRLGQFLWYYRLVGVVLFELTEVRALLLVFPNTFEYFVIAYEVVRVAWDPNRMSHRVLVLLAAGIWIFIKLPQEWWIHVAQLDFTDFVKEDILGVAGNTPWAEALTQNLWFVALVAMIVVVATVAIVVILKRAPDRDWPPTLDVDAHLPSVRPRREHIPLISWRLLEKIALIGMISIVYAQVLPGSDASPSQVVVGVAIIVASNAAISEWLANRGHSWASTLGELGAMLAVNAGVVAAYALVVRRLLGRDLDVGALLFFVLLLTLIVTLFDRFQRQHRRSRGGHDTDADGETPGRPLPSTRSTVSSSG